MLESQNVDHMRIVRETCFCEKNSGGLHSFLSFSKIFQFCTCAGITKYGSRERQLFVRHVFVKKVRRTTEFREFFKNILTLYPCQSHEMWITWEVIVRETCFCEKILADNTVSSVFQKYFNFVPMLESRNVDHVKITCSWDMFFVKKFKRSSPFQEFLISISTLHSC